MAYRSCIRAFVFFFSFISSAEAGLLTFLDENDWLSALSNPELVREDFDGPLVNFSANSIANSVGPVLVDLQGGVKDPGPTGLNGNGFFEVNSMRTVMMRWH